ncbi:hypothetical protein NSS60_08835 [Anoxybacillus sp. FSL W8-0382]|uniref:hypothetical protein n=1 Tax=Anoxybacillus TaxID=150247 RepID=UPI001F50B397|nr:hypothetical protein [Anoxybacillus flavithermus]
MSRFVEAESDSFLSPFSISKEGTSPILSKIHHKIESEVHICPLTMIGTVPVTLKKKKALEKGLKEGLQQEKRHIAKKMLEKGYDVQTIHELTELSVEEIEGLKSTTQ